MTGIYGDPRRKSREKTWEEIKKLNLNSRIPWLLLEDFNSCHHSYEKRGGVPRTLNHLKLF